MSSMQNPYQDGEAVASLPKTFRQDTRALYVGTGGDVEVVTTLGTTIMHKNVPSGAYLYVQAKTVTTNTTADNIVGLY